MQGSPRPPTSTPQSTTDPEILALASPIADWIVREARWITNPDEVMRGYGQRLLDVGIPLTRMASALPTLHSERRGFGQYWRSNGTVSEIVFRWENEAMYRASPYFVAHETGEWVELRPMQSNQAQFDIEADLREEGITHYICSPLFFINGMKAGITYSTDDPNGFSETNLRVLKFLDPHVAILMDLRSKSIMLDDLLRIYVGQEPQRRILSGDIRRGEVIKITAAILFVDMTGFTALAQGQTAEETAAMLNTYYDCVVPSVEFNDGEILKYVGDGVLAIFRCEEEEEQCAAAEAALQAARDLIESVDSKMVGVDQPIPDFDVKVALHFGEVAYGNVGSGARLDFTVIGQSVNLASRLADLSGALNQRLILSEDFLELTKDKSAFEPLGHHPLKGIADPQMAFGLIG